MSNILRHLHGRYARPCSRRLQQIGLGERSNPASWQLEVPPEPEDPAAPDETEIPPEDDADWEVFIADDDCDPLPEPGDFWGVEQPAGS